MDVSKENTAYITGNYKNIFPWREIFNIETEE